MTRKAEIERNTAETKIKISLNIDGSGKSEIETGVGFMNHMLELLTKHGRFDLKLRCTGDTDVDYHHTVEDVGIALGCAFAEALADKRGITRYGHAIIPMDESLILSAVDFSGRSHLEYSVEIPSEKVGSFDTELIKEFWLGFARSAGCTLHIREICGENSHHIIEGIFKSVARSLNQAVAIDERYTDEIPSTKGVL